MHRVGRRRVLQHLGHLVAGDHGAGRESEIGTQRECAAFDHGRHAAVVPQVGQVVTDPAHKAYAAGVERFLERGRVGRQKVGGCGGAGHDRGREGRHLRPPRIVDRATPLVHDLAERIPRRQIGLLNAVIQRVGAPRGVGKTPVALDRRHRGAPHGNLGQFDP